MRTRFSIVLDDDLVREARELTGIQSAQDLVNQALRELVRARRRPSLTTLRGKVQFARGYGHEQLRDGGWSSSPLSARVCDRA